MPVPTPALVLLALHTPLPVVQLSVVVNPAHTIIVPVIAAGTGFTVTVFVLMQPVGKVYVIIEVPADTPVTIPDDEPTVALPLPALHAPLPVLSLSVVPEPAHTIALPVIIDGSGLTVTTAVALQPVVNAYVINEVPAITPVTNPVALPTLTAPAPALHTPPLTLSFNVVVNPAHTLSVPVITVGLGFTVMVAVANALPQLSDNE